jgi:hypothetical protein
MCEDFAITCLPDIYSTATFDLVDWVAYDVDAKDGYTCDADYIHSENPFCAYCDSGYPSSCH